VCGHQLPIHCGKQILIAANEGQALITIGNERFELATLFFSRNTLYPSELRAQYK